MPKKPRRYFTHDAKLLCEQEGCSDPVEAMRRCASRLIDETEQTAPPANLEMLASYRDILRTELVEMRGAGRLVPSDEGNIIQVNREHSLGKRNFTVAHEIAHTLMPSYSAAHPAIYDKDTGVFNQKNEIEYLCDIGASAMLLDPRWLILRATARGPSITTLLETANEFQASLQATAIALMECNLWDCAVVFWEEGWRKNQKPNPAQDSLPLMEELARIEPELRVSFGCPSHLFETFIPKNKSIERTTSIYECFTTECATRNVEQLPFSKSGFQCYVESVFAPYKMNGEYRKRVASFLMPEVSRIERVVELGTTYSMEIL